MARTVRTVRVVGNPPRRRARAHNRGKRRRNLSAKQIKFFGTPAQKAALKRSRSAKRSNSARRATRTHARHTRRRARRNIGEILSLTLALMGNPPQEGKTEGPQGQPQKDERSNYGKGTSSSPSSRRLQHGRDSSASSG